MHINNVFKLIISVTVCELAGIVGLFFSSSSIPVWYEALVKPAQNPPSWLFGPVWTLLYLLMGISLWLIWNSHSGEKKKAILLFAIQLFLNAVWSPIFFGAQ